MSGVARRRAGGGWRRGGDMLLRVVAAVPLGYAVASLWAAMMARTLPMSALEATVTGTLASFAIYAAAAMWAFAAPTGWRATWTLALLGAVPGIVAWLSIASGGRL